MRRVTSAGVLDLDLVDDNDDDDDDDRVESSLGVVEE
jgi:hypothetical protein